MAKIRAKRGIAFFATAFVIGILIIIAYMFVRTSLREQSEDLRTRRVFFVSKIGKIMQLDEVLTMSAKMAAATGDLKYEERYHKYEPQLDKNIKELIALLPEPEGIKFSQDTNAANQRLVKMELEAFELVKSGKREDALALLDSEEYLKQKKFYAQGMDSLFEYLIKKHESFRQGLNTNYVISQVIGIIGICFIFFCWILLLRYLSLRKAGEKRINEYLENFKAIFDNSRDGIILADIKSKHFFMCNRAFSEMLGYSEEEVKSLGVEDIHPEDNLPYVLKVFERQARGEIKLLEDMPVKRKDGSVFYADISASPVVAFGKKYIMGNFRDATERRKAKDILQQAYENLDIRVQKRTMELAKTNVELQEEIVEHKKTEEALKESQEEYRCLFMASRDALMTLEPPSWKFTSANPATLEMFKAKDETEFLSYEPWKLSPEAQPDGRISADKAKEMIEKAVREGANFFDWVHKRLNGEEFFANVQLSRVEYGGKVFLHAIVRDQTKSKKAESDLRRSKEYAELLYRVVPSAIFSVDCSQLITSWNRKAEEITGYTFAEVIGKQCTIFAVSPCTDKCGAFSDDVVKPVIAKECTIKAKDGRIITVSKNVDLLKDENGKIIGAIESFDDITERKKIDDELKKYHERLEDLVRDRTDALQVSELRYRRLFETAKDGILLLDAQSGVITEINPFLIDILGYSSEEIVGKKLWDIGLFKDIEFSKKAFNELQTKEYIRYENLPLQNKSGKTIEVEFVSNIYAVDHTKVIQCNIRDISERKALEKAAQAALAAKLEFTGMVSHELRTPLAAIKESVSLVADGLVGAINKKQKDLLIVTKNNVDRLARLINSVLDFQKLETGMAKFDMQSDSINNVIEESYEMMLPLAQERGLDFSLSLDKNIPNINFDRDKIAEVLTNLVNNAIKATKKGGIGIIATIDGDFVKVAVKDSGVGIKEEDIPKLFKEFFQIKREPGGTGLGLSICRDIINGHYGKIWVESEFGKGSTFYFTLPIRGGRY